MSLPPKQEHAQPHARGWEDRAAREAWGRLRWSMQKSEQKCLFSEAGFFEKILSSQRRTVKIIPWTNTYQCLCLSKKGLNHG